MRLIIPLFVLFTLGSLSAHAQSPALKLFPWDSVRNYAAPAFTMKDPNGKTISLTDYKGKVLVLDFWATWCGPCHQTLPFMLATQDKYKDDPGVKFLFINTRERGDSIAQKVRAYMDKKHYTFPIALDELTADGKPQLYYNAFHVKFIPTRMVIDGQGIVRFESLGYPPDKTDEELSSMLSAMIEVAKHAR